MYIYVKHSIPTVCVYIEIIVRKFISRFAFTEPMVRIDSTAQFDIFILGNPYRR